MEVVDLDDRAVGRLVVAHESCSRPGCRRPAAAARSSRSPGSAALHSSIASRAARGERAAGRERTGIGRVAGEPERCLPEPQVADRRERGRERLRVRVARLVEHRGRRALLDDAPGVHDRQTLAARREHRQVVGDEHHREPEVGLQLLEQREHLGLHHHVERGGRLVGDQEVRAARERHRDHHPLALTAGELVRVGVGATPGQPDLLEQLTDARLCRLVADGVVEMDRLRDLLLHLPAPGSARASRPGTRSRPRSNAPRGDVPGSSRTRPRRGAAPRRRPSCPAGASFSTAGREARLPAPRLACEPERLAPVEREVDAAHGRHRRPRCSGTSRGGRAPRAAAASSVTSGPGSSGAVSDVGTGLIASSGSG